MKIGVIIETKDYEKAWNGMRFAVHARKAGHDVKVFLMGEGVEIQNMTHETYDTKEQMTLFHDAGGELMACGTCLKSRGMDATPICPMNTMQDCLEMVEWADQTIAF